MLASPIAFAYCFQSESFMSPIVSAQDGGKIGNFLHYARNASFRLNRLQAFQLIVRPGAGKRAGRLVW